HQFAFLSSQFPAKSFRLNSPFCPLSAPTSLCRWIWSICTPTQCTCSCCFHQVHKHLHWAASADGVVFIFVRFDQNGQKLSELSFFRAETISFLKLQQRGATPFVLWVRSNHFGKAIFTARKLDVKATLEYALNKRKCVRQPPD